MPAQSTAAFPAAAFRILKKSTLHRMYTRQSKVELGRSFRCFQVRFLGGVSRAARWASSRPWYSELTYRVLGTRAWYPFGRYAVHSILSPPGNLVRLAYISPTQGSAQKWCSSPVKCSRCRACLALTHQKFPLRAERSTCTGTKVTPDVADRTACCIGFHAGKSLGGSQRH